MAHSLDLVLLRAAAGFGKSTALEVARPRDGLVLTAREALDSLPESRWLGIDDLHELDPRDQQGLLEAVAAHRSTTHLVVASRDPLPPVAARELRGRERGPEDLCLSPYDVRRVLLDEYGVADPEVPVEVHALTAGWPTLVHLAAEELARRPDVDVRSALSSRGAPATGWVQREVLPTLRPDARRLLAGLAGLGPLAPEVFDRVADVLDVGPRDWSGDLTSFGILTPLRGLGRDGLVEIVPVLADVLPEDEGPSAVTLRAAAGALAGSGLPFGAALTYVRAGDLARALGLVADRGEEMLRGGNAAGVIELVAAAPDELVTDAIRMTLADAHRICGNLAGASRAFRPLVAAAEAAADAGWTPALAVRVAAVDYAAGRLDSALQTLARGEAASHEVVDAEHDEVETVELLSSRVHVLCSLGRGAEAETDAAEVLARAEVIGEPRAVAAAHLAMARVSHGERKEAHHEFALRAATIAGDVITASRILVNQSCRLLATARYDDATRVARAALQAADLGISTGRRAAALHNLAEALMERGEYDEASWHLLRAVALCRRLGTGRTALGLLGLAEIDRRLGHDQRARARYLEAVELARGSGETQVLVPALAGLARLWPTGTDRPESLEQLQAAADEAMREASGEHLPFALTAAGWVALRRGDHHGARELAHRSVAAARALQAYDLLADALELSAACGEHVDDTHRDLAEALAIWSEGGASPAAARVEVQIGRLDGADGTERSRARDAVRTLQRLGVRHVHGHPVSTTGAPPVAISVLGGFQVAVEGAEVPLPAWRSRQARTLVKILAGRRGRPVTRDWLREALWPDDDPSKTGHRLSVLLTTVRGVLDPERRWPNDRFVGADPSGVWLELGSVTLDLDVLVRDAEVAARLMDSGETDRAAEILADIDARFQGEPFDDEPGEEWADAAREEVRAAWQRSVRRLAALRRKAGRVGDYQGLLVRLLAADRYDDTSHRLLVASLVDSGRHGEARRAFSRWTEAMREIGAPGPDPTILERRPRSRPLPRAHVQPMAL
ncbi:tetratricopeptide repeat protein [Nocardioides sp.]|uniref:tetratricopeptide repeat protein n=1 Tax=Nocardioides sp. TaxID=35761 RepID=UPI002ED04243